MTYVRWFICALVVTSAHAETDFDLCERISREVATSSVGQLTRLPGAPAPLLPKQTLTAYEILRTLARRECLDERRGNSRLPHPTLLVIRAVAGTGNSITAHLIGRLLGRPVDHRFVTGGGGDPLRYDVHGVRANLNAGFTIILDDFGKHPATPDQTLDLRREFADVTSDSKVFIFDYGRRPWSVRDQLAVTAVVDGENGRGHCAVDLVH